MSRVKEEDYRRLEQQIKQWNIDHFDLFELSQPNEVRIVPSPGGKANLALLFTTVYH